MRWLLVVALIVVGSRGAHADDKPWAVGVSQQNQDAALALYKEGNAFFAQDQYKEALEKYVQALAIWDHPAIRYNAAVCLINLDRPVEAYEDLEAAMRFGEPPLGADLFKQGQSYKKLLAGRIAEVEVTAKSPEARVTLDGQPMLNGSGTTTRHVLSGDHQVVAEKPGYQTETKPVHVNGGDHVTIVIDLHPIEKAGELRRRFPRWVPWTVLGAGGAIAISSLPLLLAARSAYNDYDAGVGKYCYPSGCPPAPLPSQYPADRHRGDTLQSSGFVAIGVGGALVASGVALIVLNQPRLVTPIYTGETIGLAISGRW
jgi:tetratricopeptide (TPR) repeat protein